MTKNEVTEILAIIKIAFPNSFKNITKYDAEAMIRLWERQFADYDYKAVQEAIDCIISTDTTGFAPTIGKVKEMIVKLNTPEEMTEIETWNLVKRALRNSLYNYNDEFEKLPVIVQRLVGDPLKLREWAMMTTEEINTVVESNFMRSYRARVTHERELLKMPSHIRISMQEKGLLKIGNLEMQIKRIE